MRRALVCLMASVLFCSYADAHIGNAIYPIYELSPGALPDLHDGTLQDWESVLPGASLDQNAFAPLNVADGAGINPADLAYRVFFAWNSDDQRLYVAIERVDDVYINTYAGGDLVNIWQFDGIEFMVDGDHSGGAYNGFDANTYSAEELKLLTNYQAQQYVAIARAPDNRLLGYQGAGQGWVTLPPWADAGGFEDGQSPNTSVVEFAVTPWDELNWQGPELSKRSALYANKIIGFQISVPDFDAVAGQYHGFYTLSGQPNTWRLADNFVDGELVPCTGAGCGQGAFIKLSSSSLNFEGTAAGTSQKTVTLTNSGNADLVITGMSIEGPDAARFQVSPSTAIIGPGGSQTVTVTFTQGMAGAKSATLSIVHNGRNSPAKVSLAGAGPTLNLSVGNATGLRKGVVTVPIAVDNAVGIAGGELTLTYDGTVLTAKQAKGTELLTGAGMTVVSNLTTGGQVKVSMAGATGIQSGSGALINVDFEIKSTAPGGSSALKLQAKLVDENGKTYSTTAGSGTVTVALLGDVNTDNEVNAGDAVLVLRYSAGLISLSGVQKDLGDVNGDKALNSADAILLLRKLAGLISKFPREGTGKLVVSSPGGAAVRLGEVRLLAPGLSEVPVELDAGVGGGDLVLGYAGEACRLVGVDGGDGVLVATNADEPGVVRLSVARGEAMEPAVLRVRLAGLSRPLVQLRGQAFGVDGEVLGLVSGGSSQPAVCALSGYPNPFNASTTLRYTLPEASQVQLVIYDVSGAVVRRLVSGWLVSGGYAVVWDGRDEGGRVVGSGLYLGCLESGQMRQVHKLMLLK